MMVGDSIKVVWGIEKTRENENEQMLKLLL